MGLVNVHNASMPLHIACMYHLSHLHSKLFILAHEMVDREPENPMSWYAVGVWYLSGCKWGQARQYFRFGLFLFHAHNQLILLQQDFPYGPTLCPSLDRLWSHFCPWRWTWPCCDSIFHMCTHVHRVGILVSKWAEHFVNISFYSSHLPLMFISMEHIVLSNYPLADEALNAANAMCDGDPLLLNERGVMAYNYGEWIPFPSFVMRPVTPLAVIVAQPHCFRKLSTWHKWHKLHEGRGP